MFNLLCSYSIQFNIASYGIAMHAACSGSIDVHIVAQPTRKTRGTSKLAIG